MAAAVARAARTTLGRTDRIESVRMCASFVRRGCQQLRRPTTTTKNVCVEDLLAFGHVCECVPLELFRKPSRDT